MVVQEETQAILLIPVTDRTVLIAITTALAMVGLIVPLEIRFLKKLAVSSILLVVVIV